MLSDCIATLVRLICGANVTARGYEPSEKQTVFFANHSSHLDFILIWAALSPEMRSRTRPVAGADYWLKGRLRTFLAHRVFKSVLIDRTGGQPQLAIEKMVEALKDTDNLIIFPEGTRSLDGEIHPFKSGIYYLALGAPSVQFVPVYLENLNRILPKGEFLMVPLLSSVSFGTPLRLESGESKEAFLEKTRRAILALEEM